MAERTVSDEAQELAEAEGIPMIVAIGRVLKKRREAGKEQP